MLINASSSVVLIGYGSIGQGLTPLLLKHFGLKPAQIRAIAAEDAGRNIAESYGLHYANTPLTPENYRTILAHHLRTGDWLINVAVEVSSVDLIKWCKRHGVLYLDTCVEPWSGGYQNADCIGDTTNYALHHQALSLYEAGAPTAVIAHGANPGLVSHFVKAGLHELAKIKGVEISQSWCALAQRLGIKVIQIAERDAQATGIQIPRGVFANTWSVDGFMAEARQHAELGWGSHEARFPEGANCHAVGDQSGIYLNQHSATVMVKSWVPSIGAQPAFFIAHHEALSIANLLTIRSENSSAPQYRPTVYFAYHPAEMAQDALKQWVSGRFAPPIIKRVLRDELETGFDQLGVLFVFSGGAYWYGSTLHLSDARKLAAHNNATSLQVCAGIIGALQWMAKHPNAGVIEAEAMDAAEILKTAAPYLGDVSGVLSDWQPTREDGALQFADFVLQP